MCLSNLFIFEGLIDAQGQMEFLDIQAVAGPPSLTRALGVPILGITWEYWVYIIQIRRCKRDIMGHIQRWNVFFFSGFPKFEAHHAVRTTDGNTSVLVGISAGRVHQGRDEELEA